MAVHTLSFTVTPDSTNPAEVQAAGVFGDHNATKMEFTVPSEPSGCRYRLEITDGSGAYDITELLDAQNGVVSCLIPRKWTSAGVAHVRLIAVKIDKNGNEELCFHAPPAHLFFEERDDGEPITDILPAWQEVMTRAETVTDTVHHALTSGELNGKDGHSGVYVGTGEMPANCNVQVDPSGEALQPEDVRAKPIATTQNYQDFLLYKEDYSKHAVLLLSASGRNSLGNAIEFTIPITLLGDTYSVNAAVPVYDFEGGIKEFVRCFCSLPHATKANSGCDEPWVFSKETQEPVYRLFGL